MAADRNLGAAIPLPPTKFRRALVVDDQLFVRVSLKNMLLQLGADRVEEACDGEDAIAKVQRPGTVFDLIFCDLQMPGRDGIETLRELAKIGTRACIVLMSGEDKAILAAAVNLAKSHGLRILGHATKPVSISQVKHFLAAAEVADNDGKTPEAVSAPIADHDIRRGLAANEFFVAFQPKVTIADRAIHGVEALVRWRHPQHGLVNPLLFIGIAEESDTIDMLTDFVLAQALDAQTAWNSQGQKLQIAVNISTKSMVRLDLPDRLAAMIASRGGDPATVILEVTESRLVSDLSTFLDIATRLRLKGMRLAIDDFGTGFSTLEQVSRLPVSELKIDRAFVAGTPDNPRTRAILEASLLLARSLNLSTVCEGAETAAEWDLVGSLGADAVQGYYVAKPMASEDLVSWYRSWR